MIKKIELNSENRRRGKDRILGTGTCEL
jgi:hypothetical protein